MPRYIDLIGKRFGRLTIIRKAPNDKWGGFRWSCVCDCGVEKIVHAYNLKRGATKSCGCLHAEEMRQRLTKHAHAITGSKSNIYCVWQQMTQRCINHNHQYYHNYGGRGIKICQRWRKFKNFIEDMGEPPTKKHSIDRIDNDGNYCKSNCRWATKKQQNRNSRRNHLVTYKNKTQCISAWAEETGISATVIRWRLKYNWSTPKTLTTPVRNNRRSNNREGDNGSA